MTEAYKVENELYLMEKPKTKKRSNRRNKKQIATGLFLILSGMAACFIDGGGSFALFSIPLGLFVAIIKQNIMY